MLAVGPEAQCDQESVWDGKGACAEINTSLGEVKEKTPPDKNANLM